MGFACMKGPESQAQELGKFIIFSPFGHYIKVEYMDDILPGHAIINTAPSGKMG